MIISRFVPQIRRACTRCPPSKPELRLRQKTLSASHMIKVSFRNIWRVLEKWYKADGHGCHAILIGGGSGEPPSGG